MGANGYNHTALGLVVLVEILPKNTSALFYFYSIKLCISNWLFTLVFFASCIPLNLTIWLQLSSPSHIIMLCLLYTLHACIQHLVDYMYSLLQ